VSFKAIAIQFHSTWILRSHCCRGTNSNCQKYAKLSKNIFHCQGYFKMRNRKTPIFVTRNSKNAILTYLAVKDGSFNRADSYRLLRTMSGEVRTLMRVLQTNEDVSWLKYTRNGTHCRRLYWTRGHWSVWSVRIVGQLDWPRRFRPRSLTILFPRSIHQSCPGTTS